MLSGVFSLTGWARQIHTEFLVVRATQDFAQLHIHSLTWLSHSLARRSRLFCSEYCLSLSRSYNPNNALTSLVWALALSLATTRTIIFIFSSCGYLDVSVPRVRLRITAYNLTVGLPHSDIDGSMDVCSSPSLFAAYHVLLRLRETRHPTYALLLLPLFLSLSRILLLFTSGYDTSILLVSLFFFFFCTTCHRSSSLHFAFVNVENNGFEPLTPCLQSRCSSQLS